MLSKVIAHAETREGAIARLVSALRDYPILGIRTNIPFLIRILEDARFRAGLIDTGFLDGEGAALADDSDADMPEVVRAAIVHHRSIGGGERPNATGRSDERQDARDPWRRLSEWRG
jgi:acetyl/propionyl-CoA carboxylase alpha subunit